jgi:hypothetical protein
MAEDEYQTQCIGQQLSFLLYLLKPYISLSSRREMDTRFAGGQGRRLIMELGMMLHPTSMVIYNGRFIFCSFILNSHFSTSYILPRMGRNGSSGHLFWDGRGGSMWG